MPNGSNEFREERVAEYKAIEDEVKNLSGKESRALSDAAYDEIISPTAKYSNIANGNEEPKTVDYRTENRASFIKLCLHFCIIMP